MSNRTPFALSSKLLSIMVYFLFYSTLRDISILWLLITSRKGDDQSPSSTTVNEANCNTGKNEWCDAAGIVRKQYGDGLKRV